MQLKGFTINRTLGYRTKFNVYTVSREKESFEYHQPSTTTHHKESMDPTAACWSQKKPRCNIIREVGLVSTACVCANHPPVSGGYGYPQ